MVDIFNLFFQLRHIFLRHVLHYEEGKGSFSKFIQQDILADHSLHILREISQHIIIDSRVDHAQDRSQHQQDPDHKYHNTMFYNGSCSTHVYPSFPVIVLRSMDHLAAAHRIS